MAWNIESNIRHQMDNNPNDFHSIPIDEKFRVIGVIGKQFFTKMECFDEAFDFFRDILTNKDKFADGAFTMIIMMQYFFAKSIYQSQFNNGNYDESDMFCTYRQIFNEKTLADCLADFANDGDLFWHWAVNSLTLLGYKH